MAERQHQDEEFAPIRASLEWSDAGNEPVPFANVFMSQFTPHEFILTFAQAIPPVTGADERTARVHARVVARVSFAPGRMEELVRLLQDNHARYVSRMTSQTGADE